MSTLLTKPAGLDHRTSYEIVRSNIYRPCDDYPQSDALVIKRGDPYLLCTEFPTGASGYADSAGHPVRLHVCMDCAPRWVVEQVADLTGAAVDEPRDNG